MVGRVPNLVTRRGRLTAYAFACGYVERTSRTVSIWMRHGVYFVSNYGTREPTLAFRTLRKARKSAQARAGKGG